MLLILGAGGLLGSTISKQLTNQSVPVYDKFNSQKEIGKTLDLYGFSTVINCTGFTNLDEAEKNPENYFVNSRLVRWIAQCAHKRGIPMVHFSTDCVFGGRDEAMMDEFARRSPINEYGKAKALGEDHVLQYEGNLIIRIQNLCSPTKGLVKRIFESKEIRVNSGSFVCPTSAKLLAKDMQKILELDFKKTPILHYVPYYTEIETFIDYVNPNVKQLSWIPTKAKRTFFATLSNRRARELGVISKVEWKQHVDQVLGEMHA
jgi:dTDP-4-dehydrorhamnose reductase